MRRRRRRRRRARNSWRGARRRHRVAALKGWRKRKRRGGSKRRKARRGGSKRRSRRRNPAISVGMTRSETLKPKQWYKAVSNGLPYIGGFFAQGFTEEKVKGFLPSFLTSGIGEYAGRLLATGVNGLVLVGGSMLYRPLGSYAAPVMAGGILRVGIDALMKLTGMSGCMGGDCLGSLLDYATPNSAATARALNGMNDYATQAGAASARQLNGMSGMADYYGERYVQEALAGY